MEGFQLTLFFLFIYQISFASGTQCTKLDKVCEFTLTIEHRLTMMDGSDLVFSSKGKLYKYNVVNTSSAEPVPVDRVITADGHPEPHVVAAVNGQMPGPTLIAYENQTVYLHVHNKLTSDAISIHVHGLHQMSAPWMDGVSFVTQCPILPGQTFTYKLQTKAPGGYNYHANSGTETYMGILGKFIVKPNKSAHIKDIPYIIHSWDHKNDADKQSLQSTYGAYIGRSPARFDEMIDGTFMPYRTITSGLINGRGRYYDKDGKCNKAPLTVFEVEKGSNYRVRMYCTGTDPFFVTIDQHMLTVISKGGGDIEPVQATGVIVQPGERLEFILSSDKTIDSYWIRGETLAINKIRVDAILRYKGAPESEPTSSPVQCIEKNPCTIVNCPFPKWPQGKPMVCVNSDVIRQPKDKPEVPVPGVVRGHFKEFFLNYVYDFEGSSGGYVNGIQFKTPTVPPLTQPLEFDDGCKQANCGVNKRCKCTNTLEIDANDTVQIVLTNMKEGIPVVHPIHMHGHFFHVLKIGYPDYDNKGRYTRRNADIKCKNDPNRKLCNSPTWANADWLNGNVPGLNTNRAPLMTTVTIPAGGYVVLRFKADNPGLWSFHCTIKHHNVGGGMNILLNESFPEQPSPPEGFPECRDYTAK